MENSEKFLKQKYWDSADFRKATEQAARRTTSRTGERIPNEPQARIENYLRRFTDIFEREDEKERARGIEAIRRLLHSRFIVKPENISDEYIKEVLFGNFAERKGYNRSDLRDPTIRQSLLEQFQAETGYSFEDYKVPKDERDRVREMIIRDQEASLDSWFNYLTSDEAERNIPAAYRYWVLVEILKLGSYDDDRKAYNARTPNTAAPFPELDQQALALVLDEIRKKQKGESSQLVIRPPEDQDEFRKRLQSENFGKLYAFVQEHLKTLRLPTERLVVTDGEWRIFPKGSDPEKVVKALEGFHTGWCIAGVGTAKSYLAHSDLYIYFSKDAEGKNAIPRACIVHSKKLGVTEVRGIMSDEVAKQHLDDYITPIVEKRLATLEGGEKWSKEMQDMKRLADIHIKHLRGEELSKEDLRFLYEIDGKIHSTGYNRDPRIEEILRGRDIKDDLSFVLGVSRNEISITSDEALSGNIKYHYGDLNLSSLTSAEGLNLPESVGRDLDLSSLTSAEGLNLPESVGRDLDLRSLTSAEGLNLPESVGRHLDLSRLTSAEGLKLPKSVGGDLYLSSLTSAEGLNLPESVRGTVYLDRLTLAEKSRLSEIYPFLRIV